LEFWKAVILSPSPMHRQMHSFEIVDFVGFGSLGSGNQFNSPGSLRSEMI